MPPDPWKTVSLVVKLQCDNSNITLSESVSEREKEGREGEREGREEVEKLSFWILTWSRERQTGTRTHVDVDSSCSDYLRQFLAEGMSRSSIFVVSLLCLLVGLALADDPVDVDPYKATTEGATPQKYPGEPYAPKGNARTKPRLVVGYKFQISN